MISTTLRAEWLRVGRRHAVRGVAVGFPLVVAFLFFGDYSVASVTGPVFDESAFRAEQLQSGGLDAVPADQRAAALDRLVAQERAIVASQQAQIDLDRSRFELPQSVPTAMGYAAIAYFAILALAAVTMGDEFGGHTLRTRLASGEARTTVVLGRFFSLGLLGGFLLATSIAIGVALAAALPGRGSAPSVETSGLGLLLAADLLACLEAAAVGLLLTIRLRSGALTVAAALLYVAVESALIHSFGAGDAGLIGRLRDVLPVHGIVVMNENLMLAAGAIPHGGLVPGSFDPIATGVAAFGATAWTSLALVLAIRTLHGMDILD